MITVTYQQYMFKHALDTECTTIFFYQIDYILAIENALLAVFIEYFHQGT